MDREQALKEFLVVSSSWHGRGPAMTVKEAIQSLTLLSDLTLFPELAFKARSLLGEIVLGRNYLTRRRAG